MHKGRKAPPPAAIPPAIPIPGPMRPPAAGQQNGAIAVAQQAEREAVIGLLAEQLDLTIGLRIALDVPDADARWLAGEPIFAPAQVEVKR